VQVHTVHEGQFPLFMGQLVNQTDPVTDDTLGGIVPGIVDAPGNQLFRKFGCRLTRGLRSSQAQAIFVQNGLR
jgi:hypothetical protein